MICFVLSGCASKPVEPFKWPSAAEIQVMIDTGPKKLPQGIDYYTPDSWLIETEQNVVGPRSKAPQIPVEKLLQKAISQHPNFEMTYGQSCNARETRRALLSMPDKTLSPTFLEFVKHRCGVTGASEMHMFTIKGTRPFEEGWRDQKFEKWLDDLVREHSKKAWIEIGISALESGKSTVISVATSTPDIKIRPLNMSVGDEKVEVVGESFETKPISLFGTVTHGDIGHRWCKRDWEVETPKFRFVCELNPSDSFSRVTIYHGYEEAILKSPQGEFIVSSSGLPPNSFKPSAAYAALRRAGLDTKKDLQKQLLDGINYLRRQNGLAPVSLEVRQSEVIKGLLPSAFSDDVELSNRAYLAMEAGWEVEGDVLDFGYSGRTLKSSDVVDFLGVMLERGTARQDIFDPEAVSVGIGVRSDGESSSVIIGMYNTVKNESVQRRVNIMLDIINQAREDAGLEPFRLRRGDQLRAVEVSHEFMSGDLDEDDVCKAFWGRGGKTCYWSTTSSLTRSSLRRRLLKKESEAITISVAVEKVPNSPHWRYRVWVVTYR